MGRTWARRAALSPLQSYTYAPSGDLLATHTYTNGTDYTTETYAYDMLGNRIATTDAHGSTTYHTYDPLGNLTVEWGATYPVRYTYDTAGRRTSLTTFRTTGGTRSCASASTNGLSRSYDSFDRPIGYTLTVNGEPQGCISYAYDDDGDLTRIAATNSAGRSFAVAYTNNTGYNYGYTLTTPSGNTIRRVVDRDDYRRNLVTNCATYFNSSLVDSNRYAFDALSRPVTRITGVEDSYAECA